MRESPVRAEVLICLCAGRQHAYMHLQVMSSRERMQGSNIASPHAPYENVVTEVVKCDNVREENTARYQASHIALAGD